MERIWYSLACLLLSGCSWFSSSEETSSVTVDDLVGLEERLNGRVTEEVQDLQKGIGNCQAVLEERIAANHREFVAHRDQTNAVLRPVGQEPITAEMIRKMKADLAALNAKQSEERTGGRPQTVAYNHQSAPSPPGYDRLPQPPSEPTNSHVVVNSQYDVTERTPTCVAIYDRQSKWSYQWRLEQGGWKLVIWQKNYCGKCRCVHPMWVYTNPPQGIPTP